MSSSYLSRPLRSRQEVMRDLIANMHDTYFVLCPDRNEIVFVETALGFSRQDVVRHLAEQQHKDAVAVLRIARDAKPDDVTEDIAHEVVAYLQERDLTHDGCGRLIDNDFLQEVLPEWPSQVGLGRLDRPEQDRCEIPATGSFD